MLTRMTLACLAAVIACAGCASSAGPTFADRQAGKDWNNGEATSLARGFDRDARRSLDGLTVADALSSLRNAGYECATGEAHEHHPDPMSVCEKSFATRACQLDWTVALTPRDAKVREVETSFERDCVGVDRDFPAPKRSAIDDQLAPPKRN